MREIAAAKKVSDCRDKQMPADYARLQVRYHAVCPAALGSGGATASAPATQRTSRSMGREPVTGDVKLKNAVACHATAIVSRSRLPFPR
jgi:hypothetical protein